MLVSILFPTRNREEWLGRSIGSVLRQTHPDWELIVLDNSDRPVSVLDDPRIVYRHVPVAPIADLYNEALALATGDLVCHFGDDDQLPPWALRTAVESIGGADWLVAGTELYDAAGRLLCVRGGNRAALERTKAGEYWLGGAVYWRKSLTDRLGGYKTTYDGAADFDLFLRFAADSDPAIIPDILYWYIDWPGTDSRVRAANQAAQSRRIAQTIGD